MNDGSDPDTREGEVQRLALPINGNLETLRNVHGCALSEHPGVAHLLTRWIDRVTEFPALGDRDVIEEIEIPHGHGRYLESEGPSDQLVEVRALGGNLLGELLKLRSQCLAALPQAATVFHRIVQPPIDLPMILLGMGALVPSDAHLIGGIVQ
jgi:hypothetical protein